MKIVTAACLIVATALLAPDAARCSARIARTDLAAISQARPPSGGVWTESLEITVRLAGNSSDGVLVALEPGSGELVADYDPGSSGALQVRLFSVASVTVAGGRSVPDPLIPVLPGGGTGQSSLLYVGVSVGAAPQSRATRELRLRAAQGPGVAVVRLTIETIPFALPAELPVTVQATIWPYRDWPTEEPGRLVVQKALLATLASYRINGIAGLARGGNGIDAGKDAKPVSPDYRELVRYALDELRFRRVRIPAAKMYNFKNPLAGLSGSDAAQRDFESTLRSHLVRFDELLQNPKWAGRFGFKIWDEPREQDYPEVVASYRAAKRAAPSLRLELSEQPDARLLDAADVWTPAIEFLKPASIDEQHRKNKEVWIYANKVHGVDHPAWGMRILGWLIWKYRLDGYLIWAVNWWKEDPWSTVSSQKVDFMKRGTLVYPGADGAVYPSLRLEQFRKGIEDMLLLNALEKVAGGTDERALRARTLVARMKEVYTLRVRYDDAPDPARYRDEILNQLVTGAP